MLQEVALWVASLLGISYALPHLIPSFRSTLKQVHESIRTNTVFTSESICDLHQGQIDTIDRTVGQIMAAACQFIIVVWTSLNLLLGSSIQPLHTCMIGFYIYDLIHLTIHPYGKTQQIFLVHHTMTIGLVLYLKYVPLSYYSFNNEIYLFLELSGFSINVTNVVKQFYPASKYNIVLSALNVYIYGLTRGILCPCIVTVIILSCIFHTPPLQELAPVPFFVLVIALSIWWFIAMIKKHNRLVQKAIL